MVLDNNMVCNGAIEVSAMYFGWTPAVKLCHNLYMCASPSSDGRSKMKSPVKRGRPPNELTKKVLDILYNDEFPVSENQDRFRRQVNVNESAINFNGFNDIGKMLQGHVTNFNNDIVHFLKKFQKAISVSGRNE
ncbi:Saposin B-type domain-containing protein [Caenorhabditis elegans]|nr:Saposin B-type domain-containing protein [Caenorhabditis elegans]CAA94851.2 Saposin B-type domain-containing protein [Caenorhabditis elegans]|eukprot:NP_001256194.1 Uncharacterized protein CELE_ZK856.4 [Caenorhabditis elegans]